MKCRIVGGESHGKEIEISAIDGPRFYIPISMSPIEYLTEPKKAELNTHTSYETYIVIRPFADLPKVEHIYGIEQTLYATILLREISHEAIKNAINRAAEKGDSSQDQDSSGP